METYRTISLVRIDNEWHAFSNDGAAYDFYNEWKDYRDCECLIAIPVDVDETPKARLEYLRSCLDAESISWGELAELQDLAEHIEPGDVQLAEAAGIDEQEFAERS